MADLRIGVIGSGGRGKLAAHSHKPGEGSRIVACCDPNAKTLEDNKARYGSDIFTTDSYNELLSRELDAVFICSPDFLHEEQGLAALELGLPVYLEKPMAITIEGCDRLLSKAKEKNARLFVGHNMRYMPIVQKMKRLIDEGRIGEPKSVWCRHFISYGGDAYFRDWHSERRLSTGLLLQKGAHDIDVMHWLVNSYTRRVSAFGNTAVYDKLPRRSPEEPGIASFIKDRWPPRQQSGFSPVVDVEDQSVVIMQMGGDILGSYLQCHFTPDSCRNYTVIGTEGRIENVGDGLRSPIFIWNQRTDSYEMIGDEVHRAEQSGKGTHGGADGVIVDEFLEYARSGGPTIATPVAARMSVATGVQATKSLRSGGQPLDIPEIA